MRNTLFYLVPLILIGAGCTAIPTVAPVQETISDENLSEFLEEVVDQIAEQDVDDVVIESRIHYEDELLGIAFDYPRTWGEIEILGEVNTDDDPLSRAYVLTIGENESVIFLSAYKEGETVGRGAYFGDRAKDFKTTEDLLSWCAEQSCETIDTSDDITIVKRVGEGDYAWSELSDDVTAYGVYRPDHDYYGLIISNQRFIEYGLGDQEKEFAALIDSIEFLN